MASTVKIESGNNIPKFDGSNFQLWKFSITILLKAEKLLSIVDGKEAEPEDKTSAEWTAWETKNSKVQVLFLTTISTNQLQHLINCENAYQMWSRLMAIHEQKTEFSKELLWQRFYEYKMSENCSIAEHISAIELLVKQLKDVKETISNSAVCSKLISSLPSRYNSFRTAWDSVASDQQTLENLAARLLKEETRMSCDDNETSRLALQVKALQSKLEATTFKKNNIKELKKNTSCKYCKLKGHWARECRKRIADAERNSRKAGSRSSSAYICDISSLYSTSCGLKNSEWICDSGASMHMTSEKSWFTEMKPIEEPMFIKIANDKLINATGRGNIQIQALVEGKWEDRTMYNVLYVPELSRSLFSVGVMTDRNFTHHSYKNLCEFRDSEGKLSCVGTRNNDLWIMKFRVKPTPECNLSNTKENSLQLWHNRLGHVNCDAIKKTADKKMVKNLEIVERKDFFCESCQFGKQPRKPHQSSQREKTKYPGEMIHSDVCGPMSIPSPSGSRYFVLFKDDCSGYRTVYFLKHKSDVLSKFKEYKTLVENQTGNRIKIVRTDQGKGEYINADFHEFIKKSGIYHECSAPYTPQQNGRSEREMRTIVESARTMLINKNVPQELWSEAVNTAVYILNRTSSTQVKNMTPHENWFGHKPETKHIRIFGSAAYMLIPPQLRKKWDPKSKKLMLVGYEGHSTNYRLWDNKKRRIEVSCNVNFNENETLVSNTEVFSLKFGVFENEERENVQNTPESENSNETHDEEVIEDTPTEDTNSDEDFVYNDVLEINENVEMRQLRDRSTLHRPDFYDASANYSAILEPNCYEKAVNCEDSDKWFRAMKDEMEALNSNNTWTLMPLPKNTRIIDNKWVFRVKTDNVGNPVRYKARLVARGFAQEKGVDYKETFAPVVRYDSIRLLLALASEKDLRIVNFDVQTAFLYGELQEDIYMKQPTGFENKKDPKLVCKLNKSLYGLKQSPRCWNRKFVSFLARYNFEQLRADPCVFVGNFRNSEVYLAIYVDDGLLMSKSVDAINEVIRNLQQMFKITVHLDSSNLQFVGLQIEQDLSVGTVSIHQQTYITKMIDKFNMSNAKPLTIPAEPSIRLSSTATNVQCDPRQPYREAVGSLIFLATSSRPDISFAVNQVSRFLNNWTDEHWQAVKRIIRYLKQTVNYKIVYSKTAKIEVKGYTDADYAGCIETRKSTSGYVFVLAKGPITWKSQKQAVVAQSTTEAEYIALALGVREALWLRSFLLELDIECSPVNIGVDNQSAIKLAQVQQLHSRTKHIDVKVHFVRDECEKGNIIVNYVSSSEQLADMLTKPLSKPILNHIIEKLNLSM